MCSAYVEVRENSDNSYKRFTLFGRVKPTLTVYENPFEHKTDPQNPKVYSFIKDNTK